MFSAVTSWLGGTKPDYEVAQREGDKENPEVQDKDQTEKKDDVTEKKDETAEKAEGSESAGPHIDFSNIGEVGEKTISAAKEWGGM